MVNQEVTGVKGLKMPSRPVQQTTVNFGENGQHGVTAQ